MQRLRILLVEDNPNDAEIALREISREKIPFTHETVETEDEFRRALNDFNPDLIVSDFALPLFDGMRALKIARSRPDRIPFIVLTGSINEETAVACMKAGADDYVLKEKIKRLPFSIREVLEKQTALLEKERAESSLRESEKRYRDLAEMLPVVIFEMDLDGRIGYANREAFETFGYSPRDLDGEFNAFNLIAPADRRRARENFSRRLKGEDISMVKYTGITRKGKEFPAFVGLSPISINEEITGFRGIVVDISEEKEMINKLSASEKRFRILFEFAPDGYFLINSSGRIVDANREAQRLLQRGHDELVGKNFIAKFKLRGTERQRGLTLLARSVDGLPTEREEFTLSRPDGSRVVMEISTYPVKIKPDILILGIARDITEARKLRDELSEHHKYLERTVKERTRELNETLRESEANRDRIDTILKSVSDGLLVTDKSGHIILMNAPAEEFLGIRFSENINRRIEDALPQKPLVQLIRDADPALPSGKQADVEVVDGIPRKQVLRATAKPISVTGHSPIGVLTTLRDVTREREVDRMKTEFLSTAAHELRTPLTSIQGFSEILLTRRDLVPADRKKFLGYINNQAVNLATIINDLLDISRIESGLGYQLKRKPSNLNKTIGKRIELYRLSHKDHTFIADLRAPETPVYADKEKMDQALQNLLSNAVHYSPEGGEIRVSTEIRDFEFHITVEDRGIGMTREQVRNVFEKFYRADTSDTAPRGTGLGMSIVKLIITKHHGRIHVESQPGKGTRITLAIPVGLRKEDHRNGNHGGKRK